MQGADVQAQLISVIVPVFDVAGHVGACLASLRAQTDPAFEVLVIDDGSRDDSAARARAAMGDDSRFRLIAQDNRGLSGARNAGLDAARGDLIAFVDGDDRVAPDFLAQMRAALGRTGADWVACAIAFRCDDPRAPGHGTAHSGIHGAADPAGHVALRTYDLDDWREVARHFPSAWNKLYRRSLIDGLRFPEGTWFEDHGFYWRAAARTDRIAHLPQPLYIQTRGRAGQITAQDDDRVAQQLDVLDDIRAVIAAGGKSHGPEAFARIAGRLLFERTTALRDPGRRARWARNAALFLRDRGLDYDPDWDPGIARSFALELDGTRPLSVVIPWEGSGDLAATLDSLAAQHGPGREVLVVCAGDAAARAVPAGAHPDLRVLTVPGAATDALRDAGLDAADGRFVQVVDPGTTFYPGALQQMVDAMLVDDADLGLMPHRGPGDSARPLFFDATPPPGPLTGTDLLSMGTQISAMTFRRDFLREQSLSFGPDGDLALALRAGARARRRATLDWPALRLGRRPDLRDIARLEARYRGARRAIEDGRADALPAGWDKRLFARALRDALDRGMAGASRAALLRFLLGACRLVLRLGLGGPDMPPAGFDPDIGPRLRRLMDPAGIFRDGLRRPAAALRGVLRPAALPPPGPDRVMPVALPPGSTLTVRAWLDFKDNFANLILVDADWHEALLHVSVQAKADVLAINDFRGGQWGRILRAHLPLSGRQKVDLTLRVDPPILRIDVDGKTLFHLDTRKGRGAGRFTGLDRVAFAQAQGGLDTASLRLVRPRVAPAPGTFRLDDRLVLQGGVAPGTGPLHLRVGDHDAPPAMVRDGDRLSAPLPGRFWQGADRLRIAVEGADGTPALPPLELTPADLLPRIEALLGDPVRLHDAEAMMLCAEHLRFTDLARDLSPRARAGLARMARHYGLADVLASALAVSQRDLPAAPADAAPQDIALRRVARALDGDPPPGADALLASVVLPPAALAAHLLDLTEAFTRAGRDPDPLFRRAKTDDLPPYAPGPSVWQNAAMLPFLLEQGHMRALTDAIATLVPWRGDWVATSPLAWVARRVLDDADAAQGRRDAILAGFMAFTDADRDAYPRRAACREIARAAAALVRAGIEPDPDRPVAAWAARVFGLSPAFWDDIDATGPVPSALAAARADHDTGRAALDALRASGGIAPDLRRRLHAALDACAARGTTDARRLRTELLGPAGLALPPGRAPGPADIPDPDTAPRRPDDDALPRDPDMDLLRHMAFPGAAAVDDPALVARTAGVLPRLYPDTPHARTAALQRRMAERITALPRPASRADIEPVLAQLDTMAVAESQYLGQGLALRLGAIADDGGARAVEAWLAARPSDPAAPAVRSGAALADRRGTGPALHDVMVVVLSCRANLDTRIPALRAGWLGLLAAKGIDYVIVTGDGDGTRTGDIVHLDAPDDYEGLPQKTLAAIDWVRRETDAGHMMKVDDDCFVAPDAFFDSLSYMKFDYHGRRLTRHPGQMDRAWHMAKSRSARGRFELDRSPEPSSYADGGTGYTLSRRAMDAVGEVAQGAAGQRLIAASFMEDKMLGDLLGLAGISLADEDYHVSIRRRPAPGAAPVPLWVNGFHPSRAAPVKLEHLDTHEGQDKALIRLESPELQPKKIWPGFQPPRLGYQSNALDLIGPPARVEALRAAPVAVVAVMRNEMFMLPHFLDHYRRLGVTAFAIADNLSDDGTLDYLAEQPDVALFSVDTDYRLSQYGVAWQQAMLAAFRVGRWSLVADADELLVWRDPQDQSLPDLLDGPDFARADAARVFMLDMYPRGPLSDADFAAAGPFAQAGFCDAEPFLPGHPGGGPFSDARTWTSALRHRLIPGSKPQLFVAQKDALLRYHPFMQLSAGLHYVSGLRRRASRELLFAHFKYNADFRRKAQAEVARGQHFNDAEEYRKYLALAAEGRDRVYDPAVSVPWCDSPFVAARLDRPDASDTSPA